MMNHLRSDLYRLRASGWLVGSLALLLGVMAAFVVLHVITYRGGLAGMGITSSSGLPQIGGSALDMAANIGFVSGGLPAVAAYVVVSLVASDFKGRAFPSLLVRPGSRVRYLASKWACAALYAAVACAFLLACATAVPLPFGFSYAAGTDASAALLWWALATLLTWSYCVICLTVAAVSGNDTVGYLGCVFICLGLVGTALSTLIAACAHFMPQVDGAVWGLLVRMLLVTQSDLMGDAAALASLSGAGIAWTAAVCAGWAAVAAAAGWWAFRRKSL